MAAALLCDPVQLVSLGTGAHLARRLDDTSLHRTSGHARFDHRSHARATDALAGAARLHAVPHSDGPTGGRACPQLRGRRLTLRELRIEDGSALLPLITAPEVTRFMSPPPQAPNWFATFISATARERQAGRTPVSPSCRTARTSRSAWCRSGSSNPGSAPPSGALPSARRGGARACSKTPAASILAFAFETLGVHRLEARVAAQNARGNAAVGKLGATAEGLLRRALRTADGTTHDQILWAWLNDEWRRDEAKRLAEELVWVH